MTDYEEEKLNEIDALKSIFVDEFVEDEENAEKFYIKVSSEETDECEYKADVLLMVTYTQQYPDEAPIYEVLTEDEDSCLDSKDLKYLGQQLEQAILDSLGMAMVFTMVTVLKDELMDLLRRKEEEGKKAERERIEKEIELEQLKFIGTKVTRETFMEWKKKFEKEMAEQNKSGVTDTRKVDSKKNKLTGKQLFETDKSLAASDSMFFEDN